MLRKLLFTAIISICFVSSSIYANKHNHNIPYSDMEKWYADQFKVSEKIARFEINAGDEAAEIAAILDLESTKSGGMYVENDPRFRIVFNVKECRKRHKHYGNKCNKKFKNDLLKKLKHKKWRRYVKIKTVPFSLFDMNTLKTETLEIASEYAIDGYKISSSIKSGLITLKVVNLNDFKNRLYDDGVSLPDGIQAIEIDKSSLPGTQSAGGLPLSIAGLIESCTTGFVVQNQSGVRGLVTADHCIEPLSYNGALIGQGSVNLTVKKGSIENRDIKWFELPPAEAAASTNRIVSNTTAFGTPVFTNITGITGAYVGQPVCKYGTKTGYTCGKVVSLGEPFVNTNGRSITSSVIVTKNGLVDGGTISVGGDSGGPYFSGNKAVGIHIAGNNNESFFTAIVDVRLMGVNIVTQ